MKNAIFKNMKHSDKCRKIRMVIFYRFTGQHWRDFETIHRNDKTVEEDLAYIGITTKFEKKKLTIRLLV